MSKERACQAKDPSTCRYHGTRIADTQWMPEYEAARENLAHINNEFMGHVPFSRTRALEAQRQRAMLDVDASEYGIEALDRRVRFDNDVFAAERIREALAHRHNLLTESAISDFTSLADNEYTPNTAERLFSGTEAMVLQQGNTTVVSSVSNASGKVEFTEYDLTNTDDRKRLIEQRRSVGSATAANELYGIADVVGDLSTNRHEVTIGANKRYAVVSKDGVPYMRAEFNADGTFQRATYSDPQASGYNRFLESSGTFRQYVRDVDAGNRDIKPLQEYLAA